MANEQSIETSEPQGSQRSPDQELIQRAQRIEALLGQARHEMADLVTDLLESQSGRSGENP